jgi:O-antigen/teichoic acid export membrane protein
MPPAGKLTERNQGSRVMTGIVEEVQPPKRSAGRIIARNTIFGIGSQIALQVSSLLYGILVIRRLGDSNYGQYSVVLAWCGLFAVIGDLGITQYMTREYTRTPDKGARLFWDVAALRLILGIIAAIVTVVAAMLKPEPYDSRVVFAIGLYTCTYLFMAILAPLASIIAGNERLDILSVFTVVLQVLTMIFGAILLLAGFDYVGLVGTAFVVLPIILVMILWVIRRYKMSPPPFKINPAIWWSILKAGLPFAFIQLTLTAAYQFDTIVLRQFFAPQYIGWYSAAYGLTRSLLIVTAAFSGALGLTLAREHATNPDVIRPWYYRSVKFMAFLGLPMAVGGMLLSSKIINLLYGPQYAEAAIAFAILIWDTPLLMYTSHCGNLATAVNRERRAASIYATEAVINIFLTIYLIPRYGIIAASFATVATELTGAILFYIMFRRDIGPGLGFSGIARLMFSAAIMGVIIYLLPSLNLILVIGIAGIAYLGLVWVTGALNTEERALFISFGKKILAKVRR